MKNTINSLYLHFPFCKHLCNYCDFHKRKTSNKDFSTFYRYLEQSFPQHKKLEAQYHLHWGELQSLYIGGGTPSLWGEAGATYLTQFFSKNNIQLSKDIEYTMELNPGSATLQDIKAWMEIGVNRFSVGVQSLDSRFLKIIDRVHTLKQSYELIECLEKLNANYSVDFMIGLPNSKPLNRDIEAELNQLRPFINCRHMSVYILTTKSNYIHKDLLPTEEYVAAEYLLTSKILKDRGFDHYEVSNFAKPTFYSKHNLNYWKGANVFALGPSASGYFNYQDQAIRYKWNPLLPTYQIDHINPESLKLEQVYLGLRTFEGFSLDLLKNNPSNLSLAIEPWIKKDALFIEHNKLKLNSKGFLQLDSIINDFFTYKLI